MNISEEIIEMHAVVSGEVQGVGFRHSTRAFAEKLGLKGTVSNLADETVEIYAQGIKRDLEQLLKSLEEKFELDADNFDVEYYFPERILEGFAIV